jgi:signal transduction histidine kinase
MKIGQRLFLAVVPAVFGLFLVAALAYWGRYARTAPELVVILAAVAAVVSLVVSWRNTRYVVHRVQRLAGRTLSIEGETSVSTPTARRDALRDLGIRAPGSEDSGAHDVDELDHIEATVAGLSSAVVRAREEASRHEKEALERAREIEELLQAVTTRFAARTQDAQLPLHILLSSPFGELNENQEEMLGAAMSAVDAIDTEVRELQKLVQLHRGELSIVTQPINLAELLRPTLAIAAARADVAHVQLRPFVSDTAPRAIVDAVHAQEAMTSILVDAIAHTAEGGDVDVNAGESDRGRIRVSITRRPMIAGAASPSSLELRLARRLLEAQGCSITIDGAVTVVDLPSESASPVTR